MPGVERVQRVTLVLGAVAVAVLLLHARRVVQDGIGGFGDDFHFYWEGCRRFLADPRTLYEGTHDLRGFLYPPPSVALLVPFALLPQEAAGWSLRAISLVAVVGVTELSVRLFETAGVRVPPRDRVLLALAALAMGPTFTDLVFGQVNTLVLLDCLVFMWLLDRRRPALAGAVLACGIWLKVYPAVCLVWAIARAGRERDVRRVCLGCASALCAIPVLLLPFVPLSLYGRYLVDVLPTTVGRTFQNVLDQSLPAAAARSVGSIANFVGWEACDFSVVPPVWASVLDALLCLSGVIAVVLLARRDTPLRRLVGFLCVLSLVPIASPLGWAYLYVMALPALLLAVRTAKGGLATLGILGASAAYLVTADHSLGVADRLPEIVKQILYDRYLFAALLIDAFLLAVLLENEKGLSAGLRWRPLERRTPALIGPSLGRGTESA